MLSVTSSRSLCFTALLCMKCCQWLPADLYVSQHYSVWNFVSDFQQIVTFHSVTLWNVVTDFKQIVMFHSVTLWNVVSDFQLIVMFHSVTLYEMLSVTSSWSLRFTALLCMKCCQWLPADRYVSQRYSVWNVVSDFQLIVTFHSVTLYVMLSVTSSRSLCFTALLFMKCCQWLPADLYVSQCYSVWNVVSDFQQIFMFHSVTLYEMLSVISRRSLCFTALLYEMLSVTSSRSLCFTALLFMKCCQWLSADLYVSQRYSLWNVVSNFQQIFMFHSVTLHEMLSVTSSRSLCFTVLLCMKCCQWLPADHYVS